MEVCSDVILGPTARGELLSTVNAAGLVLDGMAFCPDAAKLAVVHVHGSLGNFYHQTFLRVFAKQFMRRQVALLAFNLTAHDGIAEGYTVEGDMQYVGGSISRFESCLGDIDAMVEVARAICPQVVLQGHSLGCDRVLFYVRERAELPLVLLSPCDSGRLQEAWLDGEKVEAQARRLAAAGSASPGRIELLESREYGVSGPDGWTYSIPITQTALLSVLEGPPLDILRVGNSAPTLNRSSAFVYMGEADAIRGATVEEMRGHIGKLLPSAHVLVTAGDHGLDGCEVEVADEIVGWAHSVGLL